MEVWIFLVCLFRFFGFNCLFICSNYCEGNGICNYVIGICNEGCKEGLNGCLCGKGKLYYVNEIVYVYLVRNCKSNMIICLLML